MLNYRNMPVAILLESQFTLSNVVEDPSFFDIICQSMIQFFLDLPRVYANEAVTNAVVQCTNLG
jgi:hypothetical protein